MRFGEHDPQPCSEHETAVECHAEQVQADLDAQRGAWQNGMSRRRFLAGLGALGVSVVGSQLVTTRVAYGATTTAPNTVIVMFLRGGADGLRILSPQSASLGINYLRSVRSGLTLADADTIALAGTDGWALNKAMAPLHALLWGTGELAFVPAVSNAGVSRSHFQAQQFTEMGGATSATTGWLDRTLTQLGPGTTFRALADGFATPMSMAGNEAKLAMASLASFDFPATGAIRAPEMTALSTLYRGVEGPLGQDVSNALAAVGTLNTVRAGAAVQNGAVYPVGPTAVALKDLAAILRAEVGLQVATLDVSSWDTHTNEVAGLDGLLTNTAQALAAFFTDLGPTRRSRVTVIVQSEFGRRVAMNASGGADHGHGGVMWLLGGGVVGQRVHGKWTPLASAADLDGGDVPGLNDPFNISGEVIAKRLGVGSLSTIFPGLSYAPLGVARTT
jgi:uncharacterized protein (DUF1501 family)